MGIWGSAVLCWFSVLREKLLRWGIGGGVGLKFTYFNVDDILYVAPPFRGVRIRCLRSSGYRESLFAGMRFGWGGSNCYRYSSGKYMRLSFSHTRFDTLAL